MNSKLPPHVGRLEDIRPQLAASRELVKFFSNANERIVLSIFYSIIPILHCFRKNSRSASKESHGQNSSILKTNNE